MKLPACLTPLRPIFVLMGLAALVGAIFAQASGPDPTAGQASGGVERAPAQAAEPATSTRPQASSRAAVFAGAGAWIDRLDQALWDDPRAALDTMQAAGVRTLYVQTGKSTERYAIKEPRKLDVILTEAHARGILVVGWYLPYARKRAGVVVEAGGARRRSVNKRTDLARSKLAISYRTADGALGFDGFALDIEPATGADHDVVERQLMLISMSEELRRHAGADFPLGAIVPPPVFNTDNARTSWKRFPWAALTTSYDAWLPMLFFRQWQPRGVRVDVGFTRDVAHIHRATRGRKQLPVHIIGEVAAHAGPREHRQMLAAVRRTGASGASLYDANSSDAADWQAVTRFARYFG